MLRHLAVAIASASELEHHLLLAAHLGALRGDPQQVIGDLVEIREMLSGLRRAIEHRRRRGAALPHEAPVRMAPAGSLGVGAAGTDEPAASRMAPPRRRTAASGDSTSRG